MARPSVDLQELVMPLLSTGMDYHCCEAAIVSLEISPLAETKPLLNVAFLEK